MLIKLSPEAILRGQNHLVELDWLRAGAHGLSRSLSSLMLYNLVNTQFMLSRRLASNHLPSLRLQVSLALAAYALAAPTPLYVS